jgi:3-phenylpropionate/trans-cinnamate dioxygenase ferredoxin reductase component
MNPLNRRVVIVGAGQAGATLAFRLRENNHIGPIYLIGEESYPPYQRPPLSKKYLIGDFARERLFLKPPKAYAEQGINLLLGNSVGEVDRTNRTVSLKDLAGTKIPYDILVFATGGRARFPDQLPNNTPTNVFTLRNIDDADRVCKAMIPNQRLLIVGGGYIGLELAAAAARQGLNVSLVEQSERILSRVACTETATYFRELHVKNGVKIHENTAVTELTEAAGMAHSATLMDGQKIDFDLAIFGIGILPNDQLAREAGLSCDGGISVDANCRTEDTNVYAAGDCACFPFGDRELRLESVQNAIAQAEYIADEITHPSGKPYVLVPWFWSDQYDSKLQIAGLNHGYNSVIVRHGAKPRSVSHWYFQDETLIACDAIGDARSFMLAKHWLADIRRPSAAMIADPTWDPATFQN